MMVVLACRPDFRTSWQESKKIWVLINNSMSQRLFSRLTTFKFKKRFSNIVNRYIFSFLLRYLFGYIHFRFVERSYCKKDI